MIIGIIVIRIEVNGEVSGKRVLSEINRLEGNYVSGFSSFGSF
jgi:hypothetical protein